MIISFHPISIFFTSWEIAKTKMPDLNANDLEAAKRIVAGTARSMGVEVEK